MMRKNIVQMILANMNNEHDEQVVLAVHDEEEHCSYDTS